MTTPQSMPTRIMREIEDEAKETANQKARELISMAIQRIASDQVAEMFTDWLEWHQEDLDLTAPELFIAALLEICEEDL